MEDEKVEETEGVTHGDPVFSDPALDQVAPPVVEAPPEAPPEPKKLGRPPKEKSALVEAPPEHDMVMPNGTCKLCGWKFGDAETHPVYFGEARQEPAIPAPKVQPQAKASDPNACDAVNPTATCLKCGWSAADPVKGLQPHPVAL